MIAHDVTQSINHETGSAPRSDPEHPTIKFVPPPFSLTQVCGPNSNFVKQTVKWCLSNG